jgi:hypothetical protein
VPGVLEKRQISAGGREKIESLSEIIISCAVKTSAKPGASHAIKRQSRMTLPEYWLPNMPLFSPTQALSVVLCGLAELKMHGHPRSLDYFIS